MARKSRKQFPISPGESPIAGSITESVIPTNKTAVYARLSLYDLYRVDADSMNIQVQFLEEYVQNRSDLHLVDTYIDNGHSGMYFDNRPAFNRLMDDIEQGRINCIVVKDLSRFGRNYLEAGALLEEVLPAYGVRFIAVNDDFDTLTASAGDLGVILKNLLNDFFSRELSRKFSDRYDLNLKSGNPFPHGKAPYGYVYDRSKEYYLTFDPQVSVYVRMIFEWALNGVTTNDIARRLNDMKVPTMTRYQAQKLGYKAKSRGSDRWNPGSLRTMLRNRLYAGDYVANKHRNRRCDPAASPGSLPEDEWTIIPDTHPGYITREQYFMLQETFASRSNQNKKKTDTDILAEKYPNHLQGKLYCKHCRILIPLNLKELPSGKNLSYYTCSQSARHPNRHPVNIRYDRINLLVLEHIRDNIRSADLYCDWLSSPDSSLRIRQWISSREATLEHMLAEQKELTSKKLSLAEKHMEGSISKEHFSKEFSYISDTLTNLLRDTEKQAREIELEHTALSYDNPWLQLCAKQPMPIELTATLTHKFIENIQISVHHLAEINCTHATWKQILQDLYQQIEGEKAPWQK